MAIARSRMTVPRPLTLHRRAALNVFAGGLLAGPAQAGQQSAASAAARGRVAPSNVQWVDPTLSSADRKTILAKTEALFGRALATPAFAGPYGFSLARSVFVRPPQPGLPPSHPARVEASFTAQQIDIEGGSTADASGAYAGRGEGPSFRFYVNDLMALYVSYHGGDAFADVHYLPPQIGTLQGFPVFEVGPRDIVLISKADRRPYVYVTKAQHLGAQLSEMRAALARQGDAAHPRLRALVPRLEAEWAALGPAEREAPACVSSRGETFADCRAPNPVYRVRPNPEYFDKGVAKSAVQLVAISLPSSRGVGHPQLDPKLRAAATALDLAAIQAGLD